MTSEIAKIDLASGAHTHFGIPAKVDEVHCPTTGSLLPSDTHPDVGWFLSGRDICCLQMSLLI